MDQKMREIGVFEAKNRLSELLRRVETGEEIAITNRGKIVARLVPPLPALDRDAARAAAARIRVRRKGVTLGNFKIEDLMAKGRR
jgi:prevent-host-death family protein